MCPVRALHKTGVNDLWTDARGTQQDANSWAHNDWPIVTAFRRGHGATKQGGKHICLPLSQRTRSRFAAMVDERQEEFFAFGSRRAAECADVVDLLYWQRSTVQ